VRLFLFEVFLFIFERNENVMHLKTNIFTDSQLYYNKFYVKKGYVKHVRLDGRTPPKIDAKYDVSGS
jgi:hypothetical protein